MIVRKEGSALGDDCADAFGNNKCLAHQPDSSNAIKSAHFCKMP